MSRRVRVKPSKAQSAVGFFMGIIFCFIGLFMMMPFFGPFGVLWTLFAVIATITNGLNAFSNKGIATHEMIIDDDFNQVKHTTEKSIEDRLNELKTLYDKNMITAGEYEKKREEILKDI